MNLKRVLVISALLLLPTVASAQASASDTGDISVTVQQIAITLTNETALSFGTVAPFGRTGMVVVGAGGATSVNGAHSIAPGTAANWTVSGAPSATYSISLPKDGEVVVSNGANSMTVHSFHHGIGAQPVLNTNGTQSFKVGATLAVGANQPAGAYTGTYNVTVSYN